MANDNPNQEVVRTRAPFILDDAPAVYEEFHREPHAQANIHSWLGVPLLFGDRLIGMIALDKQEPGFYSQEHARLALAFGAQAAIAIENAHLFESERAQLRLAQTLQEVGALLTTRMSLDEVFERIFDLLSRVVEYDSVSLQMLNQDGRLDLVAGRGFPDIELARWMVRSVSYKMLERGWDQNKVIVIPDTYADSYWIKGQGVEYIRSWIGAALLVRGTMIGVLNVDSSTVNAYNEVIGETVAAFANQAAIAIENARIFTELKQAEEALRKLNEELEQRVGTRTAELRETNRSLQESLETLQRTQNQLIQSEKMAALGSLVAGVSHEISTPVGIGVTAASHLDQKSREMERLYREDKMTRSDLEYYLKTACQSSAMILGNLRRAADHIQSFKQVAVDQASGEKRRFKLKEYLDEILLSLHPKLKRTSHTITVNCSDDLEIESYPGAFSQIITNFVLNSLSHGFEHKEHGQIVLDITCQNDTLQIRYSDDGKGISLEERSRIFEPFYTTKRGQGGSGLGLHIVYNLVTHRLNGHIECVSTPSVGTTFILQIPLEPSLF
jgi:signal transduction histidine kinase